MVDGKNCRNGRVGISTEDGVNSYTGTSVSGIIGGGLTLGLAGLIGLMISVFKRKKPKALEKQ
jgi:hypothetical protein